jgi:hypothetical protein
MIAFVCLKFIHLFNFLFIASSIIKGMIYVMQFQKIISQFYFVRQWINYRHQCLILVNAILNYAIKFIFLTNANHLIKPLKSKYNQKSEISVKWLSHSYEKYVNLNLRTKFKLIKKSSIKLTLSRFNFQWIQ